LSPNWFALRVLSNREKLVASTLHDKGYTEFLPLYRKLSRWSDRNKRLDLPLFPGYVFTHFDPDHRLPILMTPGVVHILGFCGKPEPIPEEEIAALQRLVDSNLPIVPWPFLQLGERIIVEQGPLAGLEGVLTGIKNPYRLVASINLLQRSVAVEIDRGCVRPLRPAVRRLAMSA